MGRSECKIFPRHVGCLYNAKNDMYQRHHIEQGAKLHANAPALVRLPLFSELLRGSPFTARMNQLDSEAIDDGKQRRISQKTGRSAYYSHGGADVNGSNQGVPGKTLSSCASASDRKPDSHAFSVHTTDR